MSDLLPAKQSAPGVPDQGGYAYGASPDDSGSPASTVRLRRMLTFLLRFWWLPIITMILSLGAGIAYVLWSPPIYSSNARMWESEKIRLPDGAAFDEDNATYYGTQTELLQSSHLTQLTYDNLQLARTNGLPKGDDGKPLKVKVKVRQQPKTTVLLLEATGTNPEFTQAYLSSLMTVFQAYRREVRRNVSGGTFSSISEQIKRIETEVAADQKTFNDFQKTNNLTILQEEGSISGAYLARLKTQLSDLQFEAKVLDAARLEQESPGAGTNAVSYLLDSLRGGSSGSGGSGSTDRQASKELEMLKMQRAKLSKVYKPKHPKIARLDGDIERAEKLVELFRNQAGDQLSSAQQALKIRTENVLASITEWEGKLIEAKARIAEAERLQQKITRNQESYNQWLVLLEKVDISRNINQDTLTVLDEATPATRSFTPAITTLVMAVFLGFAVGLGLILLIEIVDDRFTSPTEVTAKFGDSIVGQVPELKDHPILMANSDAKITDNEEHILAESYRSLRAALFYLPMEAERPKVILITSAVPNEGKSTIALNLARAIALGGSRVLLVDGDLRQGRLHERLTLKSEPGLAELLRASGPIPDVVQTNCLANLSFVSRGHRDGNPGDLLLGPTLDRLLAQWRAEYDYVLIDSCPVFAAADVAALAPKADGTLFVVSRRLSSARVVREALELLFQRQAKVLGLVFNRANASARSYYYYKYAGYNGHGGERS